MLTPTWQMDVFIVETVLLAPIYAFILADFVVSRNRHKPFRSPYYTLMVSQGIADLATISIFSSLISARYFSFGNLFLYSLSPFMPLFYANSGPFLFTLRAVGVFLITAQRFVTVCKPNGVLNYHINHVYPLLLALLHWLIGVLIYSAAFLYSDAYFENETGLFIMTSGRHAQVFSITVAASFLTIGLSIIYMYSRIAIVMIGARRVWNGPLKRAKMPSKRVQEARLSLHVFILIVFCIVCFFYYLGEYVLSFDETEDRARLKAFRLFYPTVSGNFSFINPIMLLTLNRDVQTRVRHVFCGWLPSAPSVSTVAQRKSTTGNV